MNANVRSIAEGSSKRKAQLSPAVAAEPAPVSLLPPTCVPVGESIDQLAQAWLATKEVEKAANARRLEIEASLTTLLGVKPEGTETHKGEAFKVSIEGKLDRKIDVEALAGVLNHIPEEVRKRLFRWKPELAISEYRFIEANEPEVFQVVAKAVTTKPAKPSVAVAPLAKK